MNAVLENILSRRSIRRFREEPVNEEELNTILKAGSFAPSAKGMQSWRFTAVVNPDMIDRINETIRRALRALSDDEMPSFSDSLLKKAEDKNADFLFNAPVYIIVSNLKGYRNSMADSALAIGNMMLAAHSLGVGSCWLNQLPRLTDKPIIRVILNELGIPSTHDVFGSLALGYPAETPKPAAPRRDVINIIK